MSPHHNSFHQRWLLQGNQISFVEDGNTMETQLKAGSEGTEAAPDRILIV